MRGRRANPYLFQFLVGRLRTLAGQRAGLEGQRSTLWSEFARIIRELRPRWVLVENVPGVLSSGSGRFFGTILGDLAKSGYDAEWQSIPAAWVGAPHLRWRVFVVAYPNRNGEQQQEGALGQERGRTSDCGQAAAANASSNRCGAQETEVFARRARLESSDWWRTEPDVGRLVHGLPCRMDRIRCLGNAVVPAVAEYVGRMIVAADGAIGGIG